MNRRRRQRLCDRALARRGEVGAARRYPERSEGSLVPSELTRILRTAKDLTTFSHVHLRKHCSSA
jgi:hypothetical protein